MNQSLIKCKTSCLVDTPCLSNAHSAGDNDSWLDSVRGNDETFVRGVRTK